MLAFVSGACWDLNGVGSHAFARLPVAVPVVELQSLAVICNW